MFFFINGINLKKCQYLTFFNISSIILVINLNLLIIYTYDIHTCTIYMYVI